MRSNGRSVHNSSAPVAVGAPKSSDGLECAAAGSPESTATTSRNTPISWFRNSSAVWNLSSGFGAVAFSTQPISVSRKW